VVAWKADVRRFCHRPDFVDSMQISGSRFYVGKMFLRHSVVFSLVNAFELRVALLNTRIAELTFSLTSELTASRENAKRQPLVKAGTNVLVEIDVIGRKQGFSLPQGNCILRSLTDPCLDLLSAFKESGIFRP
jgi:hypothetical protein